MADLLETSDSDRSNDWFPLVEHTWRHAQEQAAAGATETVRPRTGATEVQVLRRDLYVHVDAVRVKNVPATWGRSVTVIKLRISGMRQGTNQLRGWALHGEGKPHRKHILTYLICFRVVW